MKPDLVAASVIRPSFSYRPLLAAALLAVAPRVVQASPPIQLLAGAGLAMPKAPDAFDEQWDSGLDVAAGISVPLTSRLNVRGVFSYSSMPLDAAGFAAGIAAEARAAGMSAADAGRIETGIDGGEFRRLSVAGELKLATMHGVPVSPYLFGGGGVTRVSLEEAMISIQLPDSVPVVRTIREDRETRRSVAFGAGVDFDLWDFVMLFGEFRYQLVLNDADDTGFAVARAGVLIGL